MMFMETTECGEMKNEWIKYDVMQDLMGIHNIQLFQII